MNTRGLFLAMAAFSVLVPPALADPVFFENRAQFLQVRNLGLEEPKVPIYHEGKLIRRQKNEVIEGFFRVGKRRRYPQVLADLAANTSFRLTYQKRNGRSGGLGTSIVTSPSLRLNQGLDLFPEVRRVSVYAKGSHATYRSKLTAEFPGVASVLLNRRLESVRPGRSRFELTTQFRTVAEVELSDDGEVVGNDRFRILTLSSMFADEDRYDANAIRFEALGGAVTTLPLTASTPRDDYLFPAPVAVGSWIELVKGRDSTWNPDSPTIRIEIKNRGGLQIGVQGFLTNSTHPKDDSLSVWLEWIAAPDTVPAGTVKTFEFEAIATPPE